MLVKKIYEGITCFPDTNEFWNLYIVLMKEKDFFFDAFARETVDLDSPAKYQHAYFTTDGQVLDFNRNMDTTSMEKSINSTNSSMPKAIS